LNSGERIPHQLFIEQFQLEQPLSLKINLTMKITLLVIGKTNSEYLKNAIEEYSKRLRRYVVFNMVEITDVKKNKSTSIYLQKKKEGELILSKINNTCEIHLFDEKGKLYSSKEFASFIEKKTLQGLKELIFIVGGPYGFSDELKNKAHSKISLSKMTFSHQMVRILCVEQIYRAFTILNGEPYHHD
jgi:23S rRNA (pseudouridine1915-N3)-methyltransferase